MRNLIIFIAYYLCSLYAPKRIRSNARTPSEENRRQRTSKPRSKRPFLQRPSSRIVNPGPTFLRARNYPRDHLSDSYRDDLQATGSCHRSDCRNSENPSRGCRPAQVRRKVLFFVAFTVITLKGFYLEQEAIRNVALHRRLPVQSSR